MSVVRFILPAVIAVRSHRVAVERVWRAKVYGGKGLDGLLARLAKSLRK
jgi:hypothetical protein